MLLNQSRTSNAHELVAHRDSDLVKVADLVTLHRNFDSNSDCDNDHDEFDQESSNNSRKNSKNSKNHKNSKNTKSKNSNRNSNNTNYNNHTSHNTDIEKTVNNGTDDMEISEMQHLQKKTLVTEEKDSDHDTDSPKKHQVKNNVSASNGSSNSCGGQRHTTHNTAQKLQESSENSRDCRAQSAFSRDSYGLILNHGEDVRDVPKKLKAHAESPFDVSTTKDEFESCCETLMLSCNNPRNLFCVLNGIAKKLHFSNPMYRTIGTKKSMVRFKLLKYGVQEFLQVLGYETRGTTSRIALLMDQPPLDVLTAAQEVYQEFITRCDRKRSAIDAIKMFSPKELRSTKNHKHRKRKKEKEPRLVIEKRLMKQQCHHMVVLYHLVLKF